MKRIVFIIFIVLITSACNSFRFTYDKYKQQSTLRINQRISTYTPQDSWLNKYNHFGNVSAEHFGQVADDGKITVTLTITHNYDQIYDLPDSVLYIDLNGKVTKLIALEQSSKEMVSAQATQTSETTEDEESEEIETTSTSSINLQTTISTKQIFAIPPELFDAFSNAAKLSYRQYIGNQAIDIIPTYWEKNDIATFYKSINNK